MSDDDKTVFGQRLPQPPRRGGGQGQGQGGQGGGERTVFGTPLPQAGGGRSAPTGQPPPQQSPGHEDTWLGGALNPGAWDQPGQPQSPPPAAPPPNYGGQPQGGYQNPQYAPQSTGPSGPGMFPDIPNRDQPQQEQIRPRIALSDAMKGTGLGAGGSTNPLVRSAANLLILLGRLRTGLVEMQAGPLIDHVAREIHEFEKTAIEEGASPEDAKDGQYVLAATADDIVQNLPGSDRELWLRYSMVARFFGSRDSGIGFFQKMDQAMKAPGQKFHLLELMLTCLSLGFEGQYRTVNNGAVELARIRAAIYETLRRVAPRPDDDVSVRWQPVVVNGKRRYGGFPLWILMAICSALVVGAYAGFAYFLNQETLEVQGDLIALHNIDDSIYIERAQPPEKQVAFVAPQSTQLERIEDGLAARIADGSVVVEEKGEWILVRMGDVLRFATGSAELTSEFAPLAEEIGRVLNDEPGPVRVVGHTDSRGSLQSNEALSVARAETVAGVLANYFDNPTRISIEGMGPNDPIATNDTPEGRALNRRVEVMIRKEGVLEAEAEAAAEAAASEGEVGE